MAHFVRQRPASTWTPGSVITQAELEAIDDNLSKAINGDDGGTWAPVAAIIIGGAGLQVDGDLNMPGPGALQLSGAGDFVCDKNAEFNGTTLDINAGTTSFTGTVDFGLTSTPTFFSPVVFKDDVQLGDGVGDNITVAGSSFFTQPASFSNGLAVSSSAAQFFGDVQLGSIAGDAITLNGSMSVNAPMTLSGSGQFVHRVTTGADADTTYGVNTVDEIKVNGLTADRIYTISNTGAVAGSRIRLSTNVAANKVTVRRSDLTVIGELQFGTATKYNWMELVYLGGSWVISTSVYT